MKNPLTWSMRFAIAISAVFALAALFAGGLSYVMQSEEMFRRLQADVRTDTESLALGAKDGDLQDLIDQIAARTAVIHDASQIVAFIPADGSAPQGNARIAAPFDGVRHLIPGKDFALAAPPVDDLPESYVAYGMRLPEGWLMTGRDDAWQREQTEILLNSFGWGLGLALLLSTGFAVFIARRTEVRIRRMESVLEAVGAGRHELRIHDGGEDDVARLAQSVDRALDRLEAGMDAIRQVSTDVAHDLRAPLSRLRLRLEPIALNQGLPSESRREIGNALADLDQVSETFDAILRLSRMQAGMIEIANSPVDLAALCRDIYDVLAPSAEDMGHTLMLDLPEQAIVAGERELLTQAIVNLTDNAMRHSPPPAKIVLTVRKLGEQILLSVSDDGPGIPERELTRVRERFVRLDTSRNMPGSGLGLALVEAISKLHQVDFRLENTSPGLRATLIFEIPEQHGSTGRKSDRSSK